MTTEISRAHATCWGCSWRYTGSDALDRAKEHHQVSEHRVRVHERLVHEFAGKDKSIMQQRELVS